MKSKTKREEVLSDIARLFELAKSNVKSHPERANRYVRLARAISMRTRVRIPQKFKRAFCKKCFTYWIPGYNVKVYKKEKQKIIEYVCECGAIRRFCYK